MNKKTIKTLSKTPLSLNKETLRLLSNDEIESVAGGTHSDQEAILSGYGACHPRTIYPPTKRCA